MELAEQREASKIISIVLLILIVVACIMEAAFVAYDAGTNPMSPYCKEALD